MFDKAEQIEKENDSDRWTQGGRKEWMGSDG